MEVSCTNRIEDHIDTAFAKGRRERCFLRLVGELEGDLFAKQPEIPLQITNSLASRARSGEDEKVK